MNPFDKPPAFSSKRCDPLKKASDSSYTSTKSCDRCGMFYPHTQLKSGKASGRPAFRLICPACAYTKKET